MSTPTNEQREAALRERLAKISPVPWCVDPRYPRRVYCDDATGTQVARCFDTYTNTISVETEDANADFIANAPADLSWLLSRIEELAKERDALKPDPRTHLVRVAIEMLPVFGEWSEPLQVRIAGQESDVLSLQFRRPSASSSGANTP